MRNMILVLLGFVCVPLFSQEADSVFMSVVYKAGYMYTKSDSLNGGDVMMLDIGKRSSHFFSEYERLNRKAIDDMNRSGSISMTRLREQTKGYGAAQRYNVYKNFPAEGKLLYTEDVFSDEFEYEEDMPKISWDYLEGDTLICGYKCQKAVGKLRGRTWNVWFTPDIPVQDGPWKLCGLPGLILQAEESEHIFWFKCEGIERSKGKVVKKAKGKFVKCTPEKLQSLLIESRKNFNVYLEKYLGFKMVEDMRKRYGEDAVKDKEYYLMEYYY